MELTPPSSCDGVRKELLWERREEEHLSGIAKLAHEVSVRHEAKSVRARALYTGFGIPAAVLPLIGSAIVDYVPSEHSYIITIVLLLASVSSALSSFLDWGRRSQQHSEFAGRYGDLKNEIDSQLCRPKDGRVACDVMLERVKERFSHLNLAAPQL